MLTGGMQLSVAYVEEVRKTMKMEELAMLGEFAVKCEFLTANIIKASKQRKPNRILEAVRGPNIN